jgi:deoxyadenosine/deoxycytidine kinase
MRVSSNRYIVVEGPIGAGATSLARSIAERLRSDAVLDETEKNPFLRRFYNEPERYALQVQLAFLRNRWEQQKLLPADRLSGVIVDYLFDRDNLFARLTLRDDEFAVYSFFAGLLQPAPRVPDLVIYLQATPQTLAERIAKRARPYEQGMGQEYLQHIVQTYNRCFFHFTAAPLLVINTEEIDFVNSENDLDYLIQKIERSQSGVSYYVAEKRHDS